MQPILIIEDDERLLFALNQSVRAAGYEADAVRSAEDAILLFEGDESKVPSAILLDLGLPGMEGGHFMQWIRHHPRLSRVPVIVVTGAADVGSRLELRPDRILSKPVSPEDLEIALQGVLHR
ncbi:MAG: response regulator [Myxococcaceae bacterium]